MKKYDIDYIKMTAINLSYGVVRCSNKILMKGITICQGGVTTKIKNKEYIEYIVLIGYKIKSINPLFQHTL